jgi:hypothetical protein
LARSQVLQRTNVPPRTLAAWQETALTPTGAELVKLARQESTAQWTAVRQFRNQLAKLTPGTLEYGLVLQSLLTVYAEAVKWSNTWQQIGVPGANFAAVKRTLDQLEVEFTAANAKLTALQAQETAAKTIFAFTPPSF